MPQVREAHLGSKPREYPDSPSLRRQGWVENYAVFVANAFTRAFRRLL